ncbi:MAG: hypothetical protein QF578_12770 [Alphaproteobacteria bacterium]|nr:hypothetical protein [Alphaproteobacteria bacterium]MDP6565692.1 hypothetical protein [Alphaproteobacteria bacterium]
MRLKPARGARSCWAILLVALCLLPAAAPSAHHVLGRPSYGLSEDSNTPPGVQGEALIGDFNVNYMVFPAFPQPGEPGRIAFYAKRLSDGAPFQGEVAFSIRGDSWLSWLGLGHHPVALGRQPPDDNVFRQGFVFDQAGDYLVSAAFTADGESHTVDFPLRVGEPSPVGPIGIGAAVLLLALAGFALFQRRRVMTGKIRGSRDGKDRDGG